MPSLRMQHAAVALGATGPAKVYITPEWYRLVDDLVKLVEAQQTRIAALESSVVSLGGEISTLAEDGGFFLLES